MLTVEKHVVLVGAGLSRNWGGYLASEMWSAILSQHWIENHGRVRSLLLRETDFEVALAAVESSAAGFTAVEREAMRNAVLSAFAEHDRNLCHALDDESVHRNWLSLFHAAIGPLIDGPPAKKGATFLFSLNQDLLLERAMPRSTSVNPPFMPGIPAVRDPWFPNIPYQPHLKALTDDDVVMVPDVVPADFLKPNGLHVVKLHGSINWRASAGSGSTENVLVLGDGKSATIGRFPLLAAYHAEFRNVLNAGDMRLLVVGYSFRDPHINSVINAAVRDNGMRVFVVDRKPPDEMRRILTQPGCDDIWSGVIGLVDRPIADAFSDRPNVGMSGEARRLYDHFYR